jgi:hypothetical protein
MTPHVVPLPLKSTEMGVPRAGFGPGEAGSGGRGSGGGAASSGQSESPLAGLEMLAVGEGQDGMVAEDGRGSVIQHSIERGAAKGAVKLGALLLAHVRGEVKGPVDFGLQKLGELVVAEEEGALAKGARGLDRRRGLGQGQDQRRSGLRGGGAGGAHDVDQSTGSRWGCRSRLRRSGARLASRNPRFDGVGQAAVVEGRRRGTTILRYGVQIQEDWKENGVQSRGPGLGIDGVGEKIARPCERGATLEEFLSGDVARWFEAGIGEELDAIAGRRQGDLGRFTNICECSRCYDMVVEEKEARS